MSYSDLQMVAACAGLRGAWEKLSRKLRQLLLVLGMGLLSKRIGDTVRQDAACLWFAKL